METTKELQSYILWFHWSILKGHIYLSAATLEYMFLNLWSHIRSFHYVVVCFLYTGLSWKRALDLKQRNSLNEGFNNNSDVTY